MKEKTLQRVKNNRSSQLIIVEIFVAFSITISTAFADTAPLPPLSPMPLISSSKTSSTTNITEISPPSGGMSTISSSKQNTDAVNLQSNQPPSLPKTYHNVSSENDTSDENNKNNVLVKKLEETSKQGLRIDSENNTKISPISYNTVPIPFQEPLPNTSTISKPFDEKNHTNDVILNDNLPTLPPIRVPQIATENQQDDIEKNDKNSDNNVKQALDLKQESSNISNNESNKIDIKEQITASPKANNLSNITDQNTSNIVDQKTLVIPQDRSLLADEKKNLNKKEDNKAIVKENTNKVLIQKSSNPIKKSPSTTNNPNKKEKSEAKAVTSDKNQKHKATEEKQKITDFSNKNIKSSTKSNKDTIEFVLPDDETTSMLEEFQPEVYSRHTYDYRQNILPPSISKKKYSEDNNHLPKTFYRSEYSNLLFAAVKSDDISSIKALLIRGGDINFRDPQSGYTPLMYAVRVNRIKSLRYLITKGANIDSIANDGRTAMHLAAMSKNTQAMKVLMSANAKSTIVDLNGKKPADYIANAPNKVIMELVGSYNDMNKALVDFARIGSLLAVKYSIHHGANIDSRDEDGNTALALSVVNNNIKLLSVLIQMGANIDQVNNKNQSPLDIAYGKGYNDIINIIKTVKIQKDMINQSEKKNNSTYNDDNIREYSDHGISNNIKIQNNNNSKQNNSKDNVNEKNKIISGYDTKNYPSQQLLSLSKKQNQ